MSAVVSFLECYEHTFSLESLEEGDDIYPEDQRKLMKFLLDNKDKKEITEPEEIFEFSEGQTLGDILDEYLENNIFPLPDYSAEELESTDFTQSVSVSLKFRMDVDLFESYSYGAGFWDQGDCPSEDEDAFTEFIEEYIEDVDIADEYLASDCIEEHHDPLSIGFCDIADMIQWRYLGHLYYEFEQED